MAFLSLNGWSIRIANATPHKAREQVGSRVRVFGGRIRQTARAPSKRSWDVMTSPLLAEDADTLEHLVDPSRNGHHFSFTSDLFSDKGHGPNAGFVATLSSAGVVKFDGYASITSVTWNFGVDSFGVGILSRRTVFVWRREIGVWHQYAVRFDGVATAKWRNGVRNDAVATTFLVATSTSLTLTGVPDPFDDLVVMPFDASQEAIEAWMAATTLPFSPLPFLRLEGAIIRETSIQVSPVSGETGFLQASQKPFGSTSTIFHDNLRTVAFSLEED